MTDRRIWVPVAVFWWLALLAARAVGIVGWPWLWLCAPAWIPAAALAGYMVFAMAANGVIAAVLWVREVLAARRRSRHWRRLDREGQRQLAQMLAGREADERANPPACKPPFHRR